MDISMCENKACPLKETCYRFNATPSSYQAYGDFKPDDTGKCEWYWKRKISKRNGRTINKSTS